MSSNIKRWLKATLLMFGVAALGVFGEMAEFGGDLFGQELHKALVLIIIILSIPVLFMGDIIFKLHEIEEEKEKKHEEIVSILREIGAGSKLEYLPYIQNLPDISQSNLKYIRGLFRSFGHLIETLEHPRSEMRDISESYMRGIFGVTPRIREGVFRPSGALGDDHSEIYAVGYCSKSYRAISFINPEHYWETPAGKKLLKQNEMAVKRNVIIDRIFMVTEEEKHRVRSAMSFQSAANINVFFVDSSNVESSLRKDIGIIDDGNVGVVEIDPTSEIATFYFRGPPDDPASEGTNAKIDEIVTLWGTINNRYGVIQFADIDWDI